MKTHVSLISTAAWVFIIGTGTANAQQMPIGVERSPNHEPDRQNRDNECNVGEDGGIHCWACNYSIAAEQTLCEYFTDYDECIETENSCPG